MIQPCKMKCKRTASFLLLMMIIHRGQASICDRYEYEKEDKCCHVCRIGERVRRHCSLYRPTLCMQCAEGTFMDKMGGYKECFPCTHCDPGSGLEMSSSCRKTWDTECKPLEGFYCLYSTAGENCKAARIHTSCQPGQYISQKGTPLRDTVCLNCSDGTFSDGTFTSCHPKPPIVGTNSTDAACGEKCPNMMRIEFIVLGTTVGLSLCIGALVVFAYCYRKKKRQPQSTGVKTRYRKANMGYDEEENISVNRDQLMTGAGQHDD